MFVMFVHTSHSILPHSYDGLSSLHWIVLQYTMQLCKMDSYSYIFTLSFTGLPTGRKVSFCWLCKAFTFALCIVLLLCLFNITFTHVCAADIPWAYCAIKLEHTWQLTNEWPFLCPVFVKLYFVHRRTSSFFRRVKTLMPCLMNHHHLIQRH